MIEYCHCEERSDEAISSVMLEIATACFAGPAMTVLLAIWLLS